MVNVLFPAILMIPHKIFLIDFTLFDAYNINKINCT
jgi:hypothetical protein